MGRYYCHVCKKSFVAPGETEACSECGSGFIELLETEEACTTGSGAHGASPNPPVMTFPLPTLHFRVPSTPPAASAASSSTSSSTPATTATTTTTSSRTPINITIGPNPVFRSVMNHFASAAAGQPPGAGARGTGQPSASGAGGRGTGHAPGTGSGTGGRSTPGSGGRGAGIHTPGAESPMDTADEGDEDPGDELLERPQLRRRSAAQVRSAEQRMADSGIGGVFPGGVFMVSHGQPGLGPQAFGQMLHEHIANVVAERDAQEAARDQTDGQQQEGSSGAQQQPQTSRAPGGGATPTETPPTSGQEGGHPGLRRNVQVINFPSIQVMMRGGQPGTSQGAGAAGGGAGAGGGNPQLPQFGAPMLFGLPLGQLMGLHGSPGDYAWGPQGLENIITQMLANLEDNGPPPTEKEKMESLPFEEVTESELQECGLCSVCKDDFTKGEKVVKLPCAHLYHKDCVFPWLEMHDTCPTCRFHLNTGKYEEERTT